MNIDLKGRGAIVCGSSQGIGRGIASELASLGATICLLARDKVALEKVREQLSDDSRQLHKIIPVDFSQPDSLSQKINEFISKNPPVHILVNNTGGPTPGPAMNAKAKEFAAAFEQHLICNQILTQAVIPGMKSEKYGRIINIISTSVKQPIKGLGVSNTIRGAVANWAKTLATELGPFGITVNNVLPGATDTDRLTSLIQNKAEKNNQTLEEAAAQMKSNIPAGRFAQPEEIAHAVAFLASPSAGYINGINLPVDGGRTSSL